MGSLLDHTKFHSRAGLMDFAVGPRLFFGVLRIPYWGGGVHGFSEWVRTFLEFEPPSPLSSGSMP